MENKQQKRKRVQEEESEEVREEIRKGDSIEKRDIPKKKKDDVDLENVSQVQGQVTDQVKSSDKSKTRLDFKEALALHESKNDEPDQEPESGVSDANLESNREEESEELALDESPSEDSDQDGKLDQKDPEPSDDGDECDDDSSDSDDDSDQDSDGKPLVLIFNTGGTISCKMNGEGNYEPDRKTVQTWLDREAKGRLAFLLKEVRIKYVASNPLFDSSNLDRTKMIEMSKQLQEIVIKSGVSGVVFLHGTDTLAWMSSFLSFSLQDCHIPIVITGSQAPLMDYPMTDAEKNLLGSILTVKTIIESNYSQGGVCVFFNECVMNPTRIRKIHPQDFKGFEVVNTVPFGYLRKGKTQCKIELTQDYYSLMEYNYAGNEMVFSNCSRNVIFKTVDPYLIPNDLIRSLNNSVKQGKNVRDVRGELFCVIFHAYGDGNVPSWLKSRVLNNEQREMNEKITYFGCTQCYNGTTDTSYNVNMNTLNSKTLGDMTIEAAMSKASRLLGILIKDHKCSSWCSVIDAETTLTGIESDIYKWCRKNLDDSGDLSDEEYDEIQSLIKRIDQLEDEKDFIKSRKKKRKLMEYAYEIYDKSIYADLVPFDTLQEAITDKSGMTKLKITARGWMQFMMRVDGRGEVTDLDCVLSRDSYLRGQLSKK
jgi:L-asparaginase/Glu-tRNA(Gln) amidotransferase subunit D